jgi:putative cardiolipin synthase
MIACGHRNHHRSRTWAAAACWLLAVLLSACTVPLATRSNHPITHALPATVATPLTQALAPLERAHPGESAFLLLPHGAEALQMRVALARAATRTLDLQYYIAEEDNTGKLLLAAALHAADRGVRVRMLIDDLNLKDSGHIMAALDTRANIEVRVFNPFGGARRSRFQRTEDLFTQIGHFTRRMHNKAIVADNQIAIVGGRNLGDVYFDADPNVMFRDLDVLAAGPITQDISASFDTFWNSVDAYPLSDLDHGQGQFAAEDLDATRAALRAQWDGYADAYQAKPPDPTPLSVRIAREQLGLVWAKAELRADAPAKIVAPADTYRSPPMHDLVESWRAARHEVLIVSPYFVPHDAGVARLGELTRRGVRVAVLTNSMASTDAAAVQAGYSPYRVPLLENGVELFEYKPTHAFRAQANAIVATQSRASLHVKAYVIDRSTLVLGSMNLDPRSANLNTELALFIHSPVVANEVATLFEHATSARLSYRVRVATPAEIARLRSLGAPPSPLVWTSEEPGDFGPYLKTWNLDPEAGFYRNLLTGVLMLLPVDSQL